MAKNIFENKNKTPARNKSQAPKDTVEIEALPLRGIGGIGSAGARGFVSPEEAKEYVRTGYAKYVDAAAPVVVQSDAGPEAEEDKENEEDE